MEPIPPTSIAPPSSTMSLSGRLMNVFVAPGDVFAELKTAAPAAANWLVPAILFMVLSWLSAALIFAQPAIRQQISELSTKAIDRQVERGKLSSAQADQARAAAEKFGSVGYEISAVVAPVIAAFASPFFGGLILWLVGSFALKGPFPYMKAVEVAGLSNMILVLSVVVKALLILITGNLFASPSLALAVKDFDPQNSVHSLLAMVDVMVLWLLTVRAIGLAGVSGASLGKAAAWIFGIWIAFTGVMIGFGAAVRVAFGA
ncbi:MAG: YIP1 family protein [Verrucomicrobiia bacterium]